MRKLCWIATPIILIAAAWWIISPGVFTIQPIGAMPEGMTFIYHSRGPGLPLFGSPDALCLQTMGSVSLFCRGMALAGVQPLTERIIVKLPYNQTAYLLSTGGKEFDR